MNIAEQKKIFTTSEGDQWFNRNSNASNADTDENDKIIQLLQSIELSPKKVLEVGCSSAKRLDLIRKAFSADCWGIDPSYKAIEAGKKEYPKITLTVGTADYLPYDDNSFDTIIFGFCLCLCDRNDLFKIAYEADRCLKNEGTLIIKDFFPTFPYKNTYSHLEDIYTYKMDYSKMFSWNPAYAEVANVVYSHSGFDLRDVPDEKIATTVLRKNDQYAYPVNPLK